MTDLDKNSIWGASLLDEEINKSAIVHISERISIGEELDALAFLEKPDEQDCKTYAVLDPTLRKAVTGIFDLGHVDKWRSQSLMQAMSMKPRKLSAVLS